jgi:peptidoglycan/xylan/chitin deacetylase (PgdA/CDA1 family)
MILTLQVVMYHYVRELRSTFFPNIRGMELSAFREQLVALERRYEMATLESALAFIQGHYIPRRDMCLLTFDDGLKEHYTDVAPLLAARGIQGVFFIITSCLDGRHIAPVHMNHFLMAGLEFNEYRESFLRRVSDPNDPGAPIHVDPELAQRSYRWDTPEVASFKYLVNCVLDNNTRDRVLKELFEAKIDREESFAPSLYLSRDEANEMQSMGMIIGGHSHRHERLSSLSDHELRSDLCTCRESLLETLSPQPLWPFCYPYGKKDSFDSRVTKVLKDLGFVCSFSTEVGKSVPGMDLYALRRHDCKDLILQ